MALLFRKLATDAYRGPFTPPLTLSSHLEHHTQLRTVLGWAWLVQVAQGSSKKPQGAEAKALVQGVVAKTCFRCRVSCQRGLRFSGIPRRGLRLHPSWSAGDMLHEDG